jgi:glutathione synthase/RimK-type ligase-like ATP-grasp enzyme
MIAIATCDQFPNLYGPDQWIIGALEQNGYRAVPVIWDDDTANWSRYQKVIIRSTWDYFKKIHRWIQWLDHLDNIDVPSIHETTVIRANLDKKYLFVLQNEGIDVVPSILISQNQDLAEIVYSAPWSEMIIKPSVSAGSFLTKRFTKAQSDEIIKEYSIYNKDYALLLQPFLKEIMHNGEISLVFFDNVYSHSICKLPSNGDFRIQSQFGGTYRAFNPNATWIEFAYKALKTLCSHCVYGRIDCILIHDRPHIMEVELIEPDLYFDFHKESKSRYLRAILNHL